jgi:hypothetical protein
VKVTLGPKGRNVVIEKSYGSPTSPRTASPSPRRSSSRTVREHGRADGARGREQDERQGRRRHHHRDGARAGDLREGSSSSRRATTRWRSSAASTRPSRPIVESLKKMATPTKDPRTSRRSAPSAPTATRRSATMLAEAMEKVGKEGVITVEESKGWRRARGRRRHAVRPRLPLALLRDGSEKMEATSRTRYILISEKKISSNMKDLLPVLEHRRARTEAARHHRRGHRGRGARDARRQQAPRHAQGARRRQGAGLRRSPQGDAQGHRDPHGRPGHQRGARLKLENVTIKDLGRPSASRSTRTTRRSSTAPATPKEIKGARVSRDPQADREHDQRLRQGEAPGASREARRRRRGRQGRRGTPRPR